MSYLIIGITYAFAAAVQPGPFQTYIISQTIKNGWRSTWPASFAPIFSDIPIVILVLLLLNTVPESFINVLRICGSMFLLYLSVNAYKSWRSFNADSIISEKSEHKTLLNAMFVNILNPAPYIGWSLILGPIFLKGWKAAPINGIFLILGFYLTMIVTTFGIILLFAYARKFGPKVSKALIGLSSIALLVFGLYQFIEGLNYYI